MENVELNMHFRRNGLRNGASYPSDQYRVLALGESNGAIYGRRRLY